MENELNEEQAALQWAEARQRLARVKEDNERAFESFTRVTGAAYQQAASEERAAWRRLERVAGRERELLRKTETQAVTNEERRV